MHACWDAHRACVRVSSPVFLGYLPVFFEVVSEVVCLFARRFYVDDALLDVERDMVVNLVYHIPKLFFGRFEFVDVDAAVLHDFFDAAPRMRRVCAWVDSFLCDHVNKVFSTLFVELLAVERCELHAAFSEDLFGCVEVIGCAKDTLEATIEHFGSFRCVREDPVASEHFVCGDVVFAVTVFEDEVWVDGDFEVEAVFFVSDHAYLRSFFVVCSVVLRHRAIYVVVVLIR